MKRVFSGVQPTGDLHIGNLLGAIVQFVKMQNEAECLFCVVDMHATTLKHDRKKLSEETLKIAAAYLASGINPHKATVFIQSQVPEHAELAWILQCVARVGWLERMTQFQQKSENIGEHSERPSVGLFTYPVLMAADILAYKTTHVPVGDDQKQHLNLARDIATKFNKDYAKLFPIPEPIFSETGARIMSLQDASRKMSKSDPDILGRINISDSNDEIVKKIKRATADTNFFPENEESIPKSEIDNLINIFVSVSGKTREDIFKEFGGKGYGVFKPALAEAIISRISPIRDEMNSLLSDTGYLRLVLRGGAENAREIASETIKEAKQVFGYII